MRTLARGAWLRVTRGPRCRFIDLHPEDCTLDMDDLRRQRRRARSFSR